MEIPPQNRAENFASYVLRVCSTIETVRIPLTSEANSFRESTKDKDSRVEKVNGKNINCILRSVQRAAFLEGIDCRTGQNKGRRCKKELLFLLVLLVLVNVKLDIQIFN